MSTLIDDESMNERADEDKLFVCMACGKVSGTRYGFVEGSTPGKYVSTASPGWDESCMLNCSEIHKDKLVYDEDGLRVVQVLE